MVERTYTSSWWQERHGVLRQGDLCFQGNKESTSVPLECPACPACAIHWGLCVVQPQAAIPLSLFRAQWRPVLTSTLTGHWLIPESRPSAPSHLPAQPSTLRLSWRVPHPATGGPYEKSMGTQLWVYGTWQLRAGTASKLNPGSSSVQPSCAWFILGVTLISV